jgi:hypothetical protein
MKFRLHSCNVQWYIIYFFIIANISAIDTIFRQLVHILLLATKLRMYQLAEDGLYGRNMSQL